MTDSGEKKELSGLARSIDAAFSDSPAEPSPFGRAARSQTESASEGEMTAGIDMPIEVDVPAEGDVPVEVDVLSGPDAPAELDALPELEVDVPLDSEPAGEDLAPEPSIAAGSSSGSVAEPRADAAAVASQDDVQQTPLDLAVGAFVGGDAGRAGEVSALADELIGRHEIDPVARAVRTICLAAGEPPDPSMIGVAQPMMTEAVLGRLARQLGAERDEERRRENYAVCRVIGSEMAVAIRDDLADSTDRLARRVHCETLVEMGDASRAVIEEMAVDDNRFLVRNAVAILGLVGGENAVELVTGALANPDARVRREALRSLAKLGDEESGQLVLGLLEDPDPEVRIAAAVAAGELQQERAQRQLVTMLEGAKGPDEALPLIKALGRLADPGAVHAIEKHAVRSMFSKPRTDVRIAAFSALNKIGTPHARRLLNKAVDDKDPQVKAAVKDMLNLR